MNSDMNMIKSMVPLATLTSTPPTAVSSGVPNAPPYPRPSLHSHNVQQTLPQPSFAPQEPLMHRVSTREDLTEPRYSPVQDRGWIPSVRNIVSETYAEPTASNTIPNYSGPGASLPQSNQDHWHTMQKAHPSVSANGYAVEYAENTPVSCPGHGYYSHRYPSAYQYQAHNPGHTGNSNPPQNYRAPTNVYYAERAAPSLPLMEPSIAPRYERTHMPQADSRTPAYNPNHHRYSSANQTEVDPAYRSVRNGSVSVGPGAPQCDDQQHDLARNGNYGFHSQRLPPITLAATGRELRAHRYPTAKADYHHDGHAPQVSAAVPLDDLSEGEPGQYVTPNSPGGEGLSEAFLSQVTARAYRYSDGHIRCSQCDEEFGNVASWRRHASRAHRVQQTEKVRCPICSIEVRNEGNMKRHLKTVHKNVPEPFICHHCPASFSSDRARSIHTMRIHSVPAGIPVQGGIRKRSGRRSRAGAQSSKPKMHKCPTCDYVSKWRGNISRHINSVHLALRPFPCNSCTRKFNTASNLTVHQMTHVREREREQDRH